MKYIYWHLKMTSARWKRRAFFIVNQLSFNRFLKRLSATLSLIDAVI